MRKKAELKPRIKLFALAFAAGGVFVGMCMLYDRFLLPSAAKVCESLTVTYINRCIGDSLNAAMEENGISTSDLCVFEKDTGGRVVFVSADTAAANAVCAQTAEKLSRALNENTENVIYIKSGAFTGVSALSETGIDVPVHIKSIGDAEADCETEVKGVGINNVSFRLFINVRARVSAYNPLLNNKISISRRLLLADIVYSGEVPRVMTAYPEE